MIRLFFLLLSPAVFAGATHAASVDPDRAEMSGAQRPGRCADYVDFLRPHAAAFEIGADRGEYGPRHALPALALFARSGDPHLAHGIKRTLRHYGRWIEEQSRATGGVFSMEGASLLAIHFRELGRHGQVTPTDARWLQDMLLKLRRYQFAWRPGDGLWRGSQHHAVAQATNHLLAAASNPDAAQARAWWTHGERVWNDWWLFRDVGINDIAYFSSSLSNILRTADLLGRREVFTDPQVRAILWDRLIHETSPDGVLIPYGAHAGWHGLAGIRIWALELAARQTGDGRYRYIAGRLMNYGRKHGFSPGQSHWEAQSIEGIALASLACDDSVVPVRPDASSKLLLRPEIIRLTNAQAKQRFPDAAGVDADMYMTSRMMPHKLVMRSGWEPGSLFMLVEAYPRHDPLNPTAILALERWSSSFAEMGSEKDVGRENAVWIEDLSGTSRFVSRANITRPVQLPTGYDRMETEVEAFADDALAAHARLKVTNYLGFRADQIREILFVKNRFILVRDETRFDDIFRARVGPVWNTQHVGERRGRNWIDTWLSAHWYSGDLRLYRNPPANLLTFYAPRNDTAITVRPARVANAPLETQQAALRHFQHTQYAWEGEVRPGVRLQFVSLLVPHKPDQDVAELARSIRVLRDEPDLAAVAVSTEGKWELALLNLKGRLITLPGLDGEIVTDARTLYLTLSEGHLAKYSAHGTANLQVGSRVFRRGNERADSTHSDR